MKIKRVKKKKTGNSLNDEHADRNMTWNIGPNDGGSPNRKDEVIGSQEILFHLSNICHFQYSRSDTGGERILVVPGVVSPKY